MTAKSPSSPVPNAANQAKPTPGPWKWDGDKVDSNGDLAATADDWTNCGPSLCGPDGECVLTAWGYDAWGISVKATDAEFIVRACNSHQALLEALIQAKLQIEYLHDKFQETSSGNGVIARIEYVIQSAEKGQP